MRWGILNLLFASAVAWSGAVTGAEVDVFPLRIDLSAQHLRDVINIVNNDDMPVAFQVKTFLWSRDDGVDQLTATRDLLAVPPVFTVAPAATQAVRIGFRKPPGSDRETSYRLVFTELPDATAKEATVAVVLRMSLPVFFSPATKTLRPQWSARRGGVDTVELTLVNAGNVHMMVTGLKLFSESRPAEPLATFDGGRYVLPGTTETWTLPLGRPFSEDSVVVQATTRRGELRETVAVSAP